MRAMPLFISFVVGIVASGIAIATRHIDSDARFFFLGAVFSFLAFFSALYLPLCLWNTPNWKRSLVSAAIPLTLAACAGLWDVLGLPTGSGGLVHIPASMVLVWPGMAIYEVVIGPAEAADAERAEKARQQRGEELKGESIRTMHHRHQFQLEDVGPGENDSIILAWRAPYEFGEKAKLLRLTPELTLPPSVEPLELLIVDATYRLDDWYGSPHTVEILQAGDVFTISLAGTERLSRTRQPNDRELSLGWWARGCGPRFTVLADEGHWWLGRWQATGVTERLVSLDALLPSRNDSWHVQCLPDARFAMVATNGKEFRTQIFDLHGTAQPPIRLSREEPSGGHTVIVLGDGRTLRVSEEEVTVFDGFGNMLDAQSEALTQSLTSALSKKWAYDRLFFFAKDQRIVLPEYENERLSLVIISPDDMSVARLDVF